VKESHRMVWKALAFGALLVTALIVTLGALLFVRPG